MSSRLDRTVSSADVVAAPTLREFALRCRHVRVERSIRTLVPLRTGGDLPPLFCIAGAGGLAVGFRTLVECLPEGRPVFGLQGNGVENRGVPDWTVARVARRHLRAIRSVRPHGPYHLIGYSFGGLVAYEIAQQLADAGETVGVLGLLDTYLPWSDGIHTIVEMADSGLPGRALQLVRRQPLHAVRWSLGKLPRMLVAGPVRYNGELHHEMLCIQARFVHRTYRPRPYAGPVTLYAVEGGAACDIPQWERLVEGGLTIHNLGGDHHTLLEEPMVGDLVAQLHRELVLRDSAPDPTRGEAAP